MSLEASSSGFGALLAVLVMALVLVPDAVTRLRPSPASLLNATLPALAILMPTGASAFALLGLAAFALWWQARAVTTRGARMLGMAALGQLTVAVVMLVQPGGAAILFGSLFVLALRAGCCGLHGGVSALYRAAPALQVQQFVTLLAHVYVHLRYVDHLPAAFAAAPAVVMLGAASALVFALIALVARSLDGMLRASMLMHGGLLLAATGAAGRGHQAAALFVVLSMVLALAGFSMCVLALEARVGKVSLLHAGGRARAFPRLASAFGFFGAAGVGMPGTAGFIADDLVLHALWAESVSATVAVTVATALLAIATLRTITQTFMGPSTPSIAPDLGANERAIALALILLLLAIGLVPQLVIGAAAELFVGR
ncbi:MAG: proton-conducting transporter membrane subunit [Gammaproteobacteria bacterium]